MKRYLVLFATLLLALAVSAQTKPIVLISGDGNISINSAGQGVGGVNGNTAWAAGARQTSINKLDQTMEMAQDFLQYCPAIEPTLSHDTQPDYFVLLNREGHPTGLGFETGESQVMVLNSRKSAIFVVGKKYKVKTAVKDACNAIAADWQANGRVVASVPATLVVPPTPVSTASVTSSPVTLPQVVAPKTDTVAIVIHTTASADKYCKPETIASVLSDTTAYVQSKGFTLGTVANSKTTLVLIVNRPMSKWIEITVQGRDASGNSLWSEKATETTMAAQWHMGTKGTLTALDKVHQIIDAHLQLEGVTSAAVPPTQTK
jgi:hypothetical protein